MELKSCSGSRSCYLVAVAGKRAQGRLPGGGVYRREGVLIPQDKKVHVVESGLCACFEAKTKGKEFSCVLGFQNLQESLPGSLMHVSLRFKILPCYILRKEVFLFFCLM